VITPYVIAPKFVILVGVSSDLNYTLVRGRNAQFLFSESIYFVCHPFLACRLFASVLALFGRFVKGPCRDGKIFRYSFDLMVQVRISQHGRSNLWCLMRQTTEIFI